MGKTIARIYLSNFEHNIQEVKKLAQNKKICLALKANAYGHGAVQIAKKAIELGVEYLSVATVEEGIELRDADIHCPIILLSLCHKNEIDSLIKYNLIPLISDKDFSDLLVTSLNKQNITSYPVHIKIDTGMSRHGVQEFEALDFASYVHEKKCLKISGICTHFSVSDSLVEKDIAFTKKQIAIFNNVVSQIKKKGIPTGILHCAASGGILSYPESYFDMVRPGILAYGYFPSSEIEKQFSITKAITLKPVMELVSYVCAIKTIEKGEPVSYGRNWIAPQKSTIATLSTGYGDGYSRSLTNKASVLIQNKMYPIVGNICMDQCVILLGDDDNIKRWDEAILFGPNDNCNTAMDIAHKINTIAYEVLCAIAPRVKRIYV